MEITFQQFVDELVRSSLMTRDEVSACLVLLPPVQKPRDGKELARELVRQRRLTKFQAQAIYQGKTKGLVLGAYVIQDRLGEGGQGQVYKAWHRSMERPVAIKMLPSAARESPQAVKRFHREVKAIARLLHPNIVAAFDAGESEGVPFLVMEYVDGTDLSMLVKGRGPLAVDEAIDYIVQVAEGLGYAHSEGVIHRDVKPSNLLVDKRGRVKILDLGLARIQEAFGAFDPTAGSELTDTGQAMGTVDYMPPEQAADAKHTDVRGDIYSLGCAFYYLLAGHAMYPDGTITQKVMAHREQPAPSLCAARPEVPERIDAVFQRMVAKRPEDRLGSMGEVVAALRAARSSAEPSPSPLFPSITIPNLATASTATAVHAQPAVRTEDTHADHSLQLTAPLVTPSDSMLRRRIKRMPRPVKVGILLGAIGFFAVVLLAVILRIRTRDGLLVVEVTEPGASIEVLDEGNRLEITRQSSKEPISVSVDEGKHRLRVTKTGFELYTQDFVIESGAKSRIVVRLEPKLAVKQSTASRPSEAAKPRRPPASNGQTKSAAGSPADGWIDLFDGKSLAGWTADSNSQFWSAQDGALVGHGRIDEISQLTHEMQLSDFELLAEAMINPAGGCSIYLRGSSGANAYAEGYEVEIVGSGQAWRLSRTGTLKGLQEVTRNVIQDNSWFTLHAVAQGNHISIAVDGQKLVDYVDPQARWTKGQIVLEHWYAPTEVRFRKIRVRPLDGAAAASPPPVPPQTTDTPRRAPIPDTGQSGSPPWAFADPVNMRTINSPKDDGGPTLSADGLTLVFHSDRPGGTGSYDLWMSTRAAASDWFTNPVALSRINTPGAYRDPALSTDVCTLYFFSYSQLENGGIDLFSSKRLSPSDAFGQPLANLGPRINASGYRQRGPCPSVDGSELFFDSDRPGGQGLFDLWICRISEDGSWPRNLGETVNSSRNDSSPAISADGLTLFFNSDRPGGQGGTDLWMCTRASQNDPFGKPVNLGPTVNSPEDDSSACISADGRTLLFSSNRPGGLGENDLWMCSRVVPMNGSLPLNRAQPVSRMTLVTEPATLPGADSWTIESTGHRGGIRALAYRPDGQELASAGEDGTIRLWDRQHRLARALVGHGGSIWALCWSPTGSQLASGDTFGEVRVWDRETGKTLFCFSPPDRLISDLAWSPDGRRIAAAYLAGSIRIWDSARGGTPVVLHGTGPSLLALAWSPDGKTLASGTADGVIRLWNHDLGTVQTRRETDLADFRDIAWSPKGRVLASLDNNSVVELWNPEANSTRKIGISGATFKMTGPVNVLAWSPDGTRLAVGAYEELAICDAASAAKQSTTAVKGPQTSTPRALAWSPDGQEIAIGTWSGSIMFVHAKDGVAAFAVAGAQGDLRAPPAWSPDGSTLATHRPRLLAFWDLASATRVLGRGPESWIHSLAWSPNGQTIAMGGTETMILVRSRGSGQLVRSWPRTGSFVHAVAWSPDGTRLATRDEGNRIAVFSVDSANAVCTIDAQDGHKKSLAWTPDGKAIVATGAGGRLFFWDAATGRKLRDLGQESSWAIDQAWSPDGRTLALGYTGGKVRTCDTRDFHYSEAVDVDAWVLGWAADGKRLNVAGWDKIAQLDMPSGVVFREFSFPAGDGSSLQMNGWLPGPRTFSPDCRYYAARGFDGAVRVVDVEAGRPFRVLAEFPEERFLSLTPDGHYLGSPGVEKELVYVVVTDHGQETLTAEEFSKRFGWKNDPSKLAHSEWAAKNIR